MRERIADFVREKAYKPMAFAELAQALGVPEKQLPQLSKTLEKMEAAGEVVRTRTERYGAPERMNLAVGRIQGHPKGFGFLVQDDPDAEDIFVGRESLNGAWHNDRVVVRLTPASRPGGRMEGEVIRILQRVNTRVVGTFEAAKHAGYVTPDEKRLPEDIFILKGMTNGAKTGEKVVVQIVQWPDARRNAEGRVVERIGMKGQVGVDIVSVIRKSGLPEAFPANVLRESEQVPETVTDEATAEEGRQDLRTWTVVTIDGEDAKDLDDAISLQSLPNGRWRLGVHIADVSSYVTEGSALDREAYKRGTSVYLADRVVPMLPPRLSNGICSLNPNVDRLTLSCVMEIDGEGKVRAYELFPSVIKTAARMTYTRVNQILAGEAGSEEGYEALAPMFREMRVLMDALRAKREARGALDFDLPEAKVKLDDQGHPVEINRIDRGIAERVIEEFMLVANETVAEHCAKRSVPFMYRIHEAPAPDRLVGLREFLALFGYNLQLPREGDIQPRDLQAVTNWSRGRAEENLLDSVLLRTMRQAVYSEENLGHFGLAGEYYCHFTSPIRRYPDLVVHRVLRTLFSHQNNLPAKVKGKLERYMPEAARHSSERERVAVEAERETLEIKKAEYMADKVGETFPGIISGVTQWGFYVQLPNTVEGLVHVSTLTDDYYHFHEEHYALIGERTRRRFRLGDAVLVQVSRVDVENRQIDFLLDAATEVQTAVAVASETRSRAAHKAAASAQPQRRGKGAQIKDAPAKAHAAKGTSAKAHPAKSQPAREPAQAEPAQAEPAQADSAKADSAKADSAKAELTKAAPIKSAPIMAAPSKAAVGPAPAKAAPSQAALSPAPMAPARPAPDAPEAESAEAAGKWKRRRKSRKGKTVAEVSAGPNMPVRQTVEPEQEVREEHRTVRLHAQGSSKVKLDMWGIPMPGDRVRSREIADPTVVNPFSINPPPRRDRERSKPKNAAASAPKAKTEAKPGAKPEAKAEEKAAKAKAPAVRRPRRSSGRKKAEPSAPAPAPAPTPTEK